MAVVASICQECCGAIVPRKGEIIGANGRIGSLLLRAGAGSFAAVPRGLAPGGLSAPGSPIIVATHASDVASLVRSTPAVRCKDLVLLCNGMAREHVREVHGAEAADSITAGCLFFGVLGVGASPTFGAGAPPTALAGPHAELVASLIASEGPPCDVLHSLEELEPVAQLKMIWSATLWLVCAARGCTVGEAHAAHADVVSELVSELALECAPALASNVSATLARLESYSATMPAVTPSAAMARAELGARNGWFLRRAASSRRTQPVHERLLSEAGVSADEVRRASFNAAAVRVAEVAAEAAAEAADEPERVLWLHEPSGLRFQATRRLVRAAGATGRPRRVESVVVVGAGMMGSALALELARRGAHVTVVDQRRRPPPSADSAGELMTGVCVDATSGSWAWLNANGKDGGGGSPAYGALNRLGMHFWRATSPYRELAVWCGSVVASESSSGEDAGGAYAVRHDIGADELRSLAPHLHARPGPHYHYYPEEGLACPREAAAAARAAAEAAGAVFVWEAAVQALDYDAAEGRGLEGKARRAKGALVVDSSGRRRVLRADAVALAAGVGLGSKALANAVPMQHSPGRLAHTSVPPSAEAAAGAAAQSGRAAGSSAMHGSLLFVDAVSGVHCLRRPDGRFVVGGDLSGYGLVGGDAAGAGGVATGESARPSQPSVPDAARVADVSAETAGAALLRRATEWVPAIGQLELEATTLAHRVIPADGFPAVGWSRTAGAYMLAAHSGITLAPALAALAAAELTEGLDLELLRPEWRPDRFL